ncbi:MAG: adenylate/guanylate cyclase domain-containing protein, partial [Bdellovibrionales bacterium]|nr:adenylate/guanylate cyclase domain-containing protein [Bdellovibrionales bacterium]
TKLEAISIWWSMSKADLKRPVFLQKLFDILSSPMIVGLFVTFTMTWLALQYYESQHDPSAIDEGSAIGILDQIHRKTIDFRLINRGEFAGSPRVAVLAIDDASIEREGRWPWPREKIGRLIENAVDAGAKIVAFDVVFSESDPNSSIKTLSKLKFQLGQAKLKANSAVSSEVLDMISKEIDASNSDKKFGETIGLYQDSVVMGSYFDYESFNAGETVNPLRDFCIDAHYSRTYEKKYWEKEAIFPIVIDPTTSVSDSSTAKLKRPPQALLDRAALHITSTEIGRAAKWFSANPTAVNAIVESLRVLDVEIPTDVVPILFVWANIGDEQGLYDLLDSDPSLKRFANRPMIVQIFNITLKALTPPQLADLRQDLGSEVMGYCRRFLTDEDELLDKAKWAKSVDQPADVIDAQWPIFGYEPLWEELKAEGKVQSKTSLKEEIQSWRSNAHINSVKGYERAWISIPEVAATTRHTGYFNAELDPDGTVRRTMLLSRRGNFYIPSLALKTFLLDRGLQARFSYQPDLRRSLVLGLKGTKRSQRKIIHQLEIIDAKDKVRMQIPVDEAGRMMINYSGPQQMFEYVSASSILNNERDVVVQSRKQDPETGIKGTYTEKVEKKKFLKDKLLIVGATAIGVYDLRLSPFEENYPGVETHANVLSNLLTEEARASGEAIPATQPGFLKVHPLEEHYMWILIFVGGLLIAAALTWLGSVYGLLLTIGLLLSIYFLDRYVLFANGYVFNVSIPTITVFLNFVGITSYKYFTEERKKQELKGTFAKYVSPAIVDEILKDPGNIELGGKKVELTVMFSDVRGFTTISEKLDPRALSSLLNSYLTPMTDLVFETKGTLDKYMGDAIMAFWGAPIPLEDHPQRAATCALKMLKQLKVLQAEYAAKGLPTIDIGIGLNTGDMSVGNMGSNTVRSYTVMGDSVNLGSRLEGINKEYGTRIIVSEFTQRRIAQDFITREVDWVRVKGKAQPVRIFELMGTKASGPLAPDGQLLALLPEFEKGFRLYHERKFDEAVVAFTAALNTKPDDECSQLYIERCNEYLAEPPGNDWDGVYTMKTK